MPERIDGDPSEEIESSPQIQEEIEPKKVLAPHEFRVEDLIELRHPLPKAKIESRGAARHNSEPYLETHWELAVRMLRYRELDKFFTGQMIVDLGAGFTNYGYRLVASVGAKSYIGVDHKYAGELRSHIIDIAAAGADDSARSQLNAKRYSDIPKIPWSVINLDMLSFLQALPDNSVSMLASGINEGVMEDKEYSDAMKEEIQRTLLPEGALLSIDSYLYSGDPDKTVKFGDWGIYQVIRK